MAEGFTAGELAKATAGLTAWLRGQVENSGAGGIVFGLSGGVDSALLAALCREALGDRCLALILPCHSSPQDVADAEAVARHVGIKVRTVELDSLYDAALALMAPEGAAAGARPQAGSREAMAAANLKPRLRMLTMYYYANLRGWLVAGTTNRAEMTVGYFTKYGDGGADLFPLAGLLKDEIWALARYHGLPEQVIVKPPSAGLWAGQTDEEEMGFSYKELDAYLRGQPVDPAIARRIESLHAASAHKRQRPPGGPTWDQLMAAGGKIVAEVSKD
ncbi:MAG TPA: NAD(+) synthase [Sphingobacteriaceae bacterium]|nr:NAD(+) synthase [Sphingobacteriaceae bacterium]